MRHMHLSALKCYGLQGTLQVVFSIVVVALGCQSCQGQCIYSRGRAGVQAAPQSSWPWTTTALCGRSAELRCIAPLTDLQGQMLLL